jgi:hypothetical protein
MKMVLFVIKSDDTITPIAPDHAEMSGVVSIVMGKFHIALNVSELVSVEELKI